MQLLSMIKAGIAGAAGAVLLAGGLVPVLSTDSALAQGGPPGPRPVFVATVETAEFADLVEALGTTRADETVMISADTAGRVTEVHFEDGDTVAAGQLLVSLDDSEERADLEAARAEIDEAQAAYNRANSLRGSSAFSEATLDERRARLRSLEANSAAMAARLEKRFIRAPFDGVLGLREVSTGALVRPGDMITTIDDLDPIKIDFEVPSVFLADLRPGLAIAARLEAFEGEEFNGEVRTVNTQVDPVTRTVRVRAILPNKDGRLKPGLLATVTLFRNIRETLLLPEEALIKRGQQDYVFVPVAADEGSGLVAREVQVKVGGRRPGAVEILDGLSAGDQVITHGTLNLRDGAPVTIRARDEGDAPVGELLRQKGQG